MMGKKVLLAIIVILIFICVGMTFWVFVDKNNMYHINLSNPNLIKTEHGYKEELVIDETIVINKHIVNGRRRRRAPDVRPSYNIVYYNEELNENVAIDVGESKYDEFDIGDKIKVTRTVYYDNNGLRLDYKDTAEKLTNN